MLPVNAPLRNEGSRDGVGTLTWDGSREMIDWAARGGEGLRGVLFWSSMLPTAGCPIGRELDAAREVLYLSTCCTRVDLLTQARRDSCQGHAIETWRLAYEREREGKVGIARDMLQQEE
jgi:hypothetical protein